MPQAEWDNGFPFHYIPSYSADVQANHGNGFALLGNAAGFLDPVFSSGISSAMYSAKLAVEVLTRQLNGEKVDWQSEYASRQGYGAQVFKTSIDNWYNGSLQDWVFNPLAQPRIARNAVRRARRLRLGQQQPLCARCPACLAAPRGSLKTDYPERKNHAPFPPILNAMCWQAA